MDRCILAEVVDAVRGPPTAPDAEIFNISSVSVSYLQRGLDSSLGAKKRVPLLLSLFSQGEPSWLLRARTSGGVGDCGLHQVDGLRCVESADSASMLAAHCEIAAELNICCRNFGDGTHK